MADDQGYYAGDPGYTGDMAAAVYGDSSYGGSDPLGAAAWSSGWDQAADYYANGGATLDYINSISGQYGGTGTGAYVEGPGGYYWSPSGSGLANYTPYSPEYRPAMDFQQPYSAPQTPQTQSQPYSLPGAQKYSGQIGGLISGTMNPYNQMLSYNMPNLGNDVHKAVDNAWSSAFKGLQNMFGLAGATKQGGGINVAAITQPQATVNAPSQMTQLSPASRESSLTPIGNQIVQATLNPPMPNVVDVGMAAATKGMLANGEKPLSSQMAQYQYLSQMTPDQARAHVALQVSKGDKNIAANADYVVHNPDLNPNAAQWLPVEGKHGYIPIVNNSQFQQLDQTSKTYFLGYNTRNVEYLCAYMDNPDLFGGMPSNANIFIDTPYLQAVNERAGQLDASGHGVYRNFSLTPAEKVTFSFATLQEGTTYKELIDHGYSTQTARWITGTFLPEWAGKEVPNVPTWEAHGTQRANENQMFTVTIPSALMFLDGKSFYSVTNDVVNMESNMNMKGHEYQAGQALAEMEKLSGSHVGVGIEYDKDGKPTGRLMPINAPLATDYSGSANSGGKWVLPEPSVNTPEGRGGAFILSWINTNTDILKNSMSTDAYNYLMSGKGMNVLMDMYTAAFPNEYPGDDKIIQWLKSLNLSDLYAKSTLNTTTKTTVAGKPSIPMPRFREVNY